VWAGVTAVQLVDVLHVTLLARTPPNLNFVCPATMSKPAPVMVTTVPPAVGPDVGEIDASEGMWLKRTNPVPATPSTVTLTVTAPAPEGDVPVQLVLLEQLTPEAGLAPNLKVVDPDVV